MAKLVSQAWKELPDAQRLVYVEMGRRDRERYEREKASYKGPWKIPDVKDPNAPKKPMSAFLAFGNERRGIIAEANPSLTGTEISALLSKLWKECPEHVKQCYRVQVAREREQFKKKYAEWERKRDADFIADHQSSSDDVSQQNNGMASQQQQQQQQQPTPAPCKSLGMRINTVNQSAAVLLEGLPMDMNPATPYERTVSNDSLDDLSDETLDVLMEEEHWPLDSDIPQTILLPKVKSSIVTVAHKFDNYSLDDLLQDEDLFFEDFSPSAVVSNNMPTAVSNALTLPPVPKAATLGRLSGGTSFTKLLAW